MIDLTEAAEGLFYIFIISEVSIFIFNILILYFVIKLAVKNGTLAAWKKLKKEEKDKINKLRKAKIRKGIRVVK